PYDDDEADTARRGHKSLGATLVLRIEGPRAIEVQHRAPQMLERINAYFGYRAVTELRFLQAPISRVPRPGEPARPALPAYELPKSAGIRDKGLARALSRLGAGAALNSNRAGPRS
ncbi:MAG: DciA family protein, partial [Pseudomonadota bacterium]